LQRTVSFSEVPSRIVSLSPATTELLFALGLGPSIVGATKHCNYPDEALRIARVGGGTIGTISQESIVALQPDLVLCKFDSHATLVESLERLEIPVLGLGPESLDELFEEALWLGEITDRREIAEMFVSRMRLQRSALEKTVELLRPKTRLRVFYEVWDDPLMTAAPGSFIHELLCMAGLENLMTESTTNYPRISPEVVLSGNPDLILCPTTHFEKVDISKMAKRPGWDRLSAIRNERVFLIDGDQVSRCGPRMLDALQKIIEVAYPQPFPIETKP
jgi:iron complex transport system substrate-binding protein